MYDLKVTPGEWKITQISDAEPQKGSAGCICIGFEGMRQDSPIIIWFGENQGIKTKEEALYNAHLIINAKKMFEELKHLARALKTVTSFGATTPIIEHAEQLLKEASTI